MTSLNESRERGAVHPRWTKPAPKSKPKAKLTVKLRPPAPPPAVLPEDQQAADLAALLDQYRRDTTFRAALIGLADRLLSEHGEATAETAKSRGWPDAIESLQRDERYRAPVAEFAATWKLDRLPDVGNELPPAGWQALTSWLSLRLLAWADGERPSVTDGLTFGGGVLTEAAVPHVWETDESGRLRGRLPRTEAALTLTYDPTEESRAEAEARLLAEARALLDAIEVEHRDAGYAFADVTHRREQHAGWLYRRLVGGFTYPAIADETNKLLPEANQVSDSAVRVGVKDFAKRAGISLTKPKPQI